MKIYISALEDEKLVRSIFLLLQTFDENVKVVKEDWEFYLTIKKLDRKLLGILKDKQHQKVYQKKLDFKEHISWTANPLNFQTRQLVYQLFCEAGEQAQPWGILTGIRPTKLVHKMFNQGMSMEEIKSMFINQYFVQEDKVNILLSIANVQRKCLPDWLQLKDCVSVYIGIPFCPTKCAYCTFPAYMIPRKGDQVEDFLTALIEEIRAVAPFLPKISTVYVGGGTPTSLTAKQMERLFDAMQRYLPITDELKEFTVEAGRPDTITQDKLELFQKYGVTRISINPQSFHQKTLDAIGRFHQVHEIYETYELARRLGIDNINMDLILGLPEEGYEQLKGTLKEVIQLSPESITVHTLALKRASHLTKNLSEYDLEGHDEIKKMMEESQKQLKANGYIPYYLYRQKNIRGNLENIGYCKPNYESPYNIIIMEELQTIVGFGCGASSKFIHPQTQKIVQVHNPKDPKTLIENTTHYIEKKQELLKSYFLKDKEV